MSRLNQQADITTTSIYSQVLKQFIAIDDVGFGSIAAAFVANQKANSRHHLMVYLYT